MLTNYDQSRDYLRRIDKRARKAHEEKQTTVALLVCLMCLLGLVLVIWQVQKGIDRQADRKFHDNHPTIEIRP